MNLLLSMLIPTSRAIIRGTAGTVQLVTVLTCYRYRHGFMSFAAFNFVELWLFSVHINTDYFMIIPEELFVKLKKIGMHGRHKI